MRDGLQDAAIVRFYCIVHDTSSCSDGSGQERLRTAVVAAQQQYGADKVSSFYINSSLTAIPNRADIWSNPRDSSNGGHGTFGQYLTDSDIASVAACCSEFLSRALSRYLEDKVRVLGLVVGEKRKGLRNQLKTWWGGGGKGGKERDGVVMQGGVVSQYRNNSIEFQIMQLADFQFLLRDYENALQHYKMVLGDFKADNASAYIAAASEMIFYCLCVLGHGRREAELYAEAANQLYMGKSLDASPLLAARLALINSASLVARGNYNDAANTLVLYADDANPTISARAGYLLEEAALAFLSKVPLAHYRRYMLRMVYAGHRYAKVPQLRMHVIRCYESAAASYESKGWCFISDHINAQLQKQAVIAARVPQAIDMCVRARIASACASSGAAIISVIIHHYNRSHRTLMQPPPPTHTHALRYCKILRSNSVPNTSGATAKFPALRDEKKQSALLQDFVAFVQKNAAGGVVDGLPVPMCDDANLKIITSDLCHPHKVLLNADELLWNDMESIMVNEKAWRDARRSDRDNALVNLRAPTPQLVSRNQYLAAVGEPILVHVTLHNPLQVEVQLTDVHVIAEYVGGMQPGQDQPIESAQLVTTLFPMETRLLQLNVVAPHAGLLAIRGPHWRLQGAVACRHVFEFPGNLFPPKECVLDRGAICFVVCPPQPLLEAKLFNLPSAMCVFVIPHCIFVTLCACTTAKCARACSRYGTRAQWTHAACACSSRPPAASSPSHPPSISLKLSCRPPHPPSPTPRPWPRCRLWTSTAPTATPSLPPSPPAAACACTSSCTPSATTARRWRASAVASTSSAASCTPPPRRPLQSKGRASASGCCGCPATLKSNRCCKPQSPAAARRRRPTPTSPPHSCPPTPPAFSPKCPASPPFGASRLFVRKATRCTPQRLPKASSSIPKTAAISCFASSPPPPPQPPPSRRLTPAGSCTQYSTCVMLQPTAYLTFWPAPCSCSIRAAMRRRAARPSRQHTGSRRS